MRGLDPHPSAKESFPFDGLPVFGVKTRFALLARQ
jgi:hypothetical protein